MKFKLDPGAYVPERAHATDAGLDLRTPHGFTLKAGESIAIDTGVHVELPAGTCGLLVSKSGLNVRHGVLSTGLIDEGYSGSIVVKLYNHSDDNLIFQKKDKISQLVVLPCLYTDVEIVDEIQGGERGENGYGSTGR